MGGDVHSWTVGELLTLLAGWRGALERREVSTGEARREAAEMAMRYGNAFHAIPSAELRALAADGASHE